MSVSNVKSPVSVVSGESVEKKPTVREQYAASSQKTKETMGALLKGLSEKQYAGTVGQGLNLQPPSMGSPTQPTQQKGGSVSRAGGTEIAVSIGKSVDKDELAEVLNEYGEEKGIEMFSRIKAGDIPDDVAEAYEDGGKSMHWLGREVVKSAIAERANKKRDELGLRFDYVDRGSISNDTAWGVISDPKLINETKTFSGIWGVSEGGIDAGLKATEPEPVKIESGDQKVNMGLEATLNDGSEQIG
ncbi:MAG TPA: hypothetical protein PLZ86_00610 [bacterium]|nr:hypothetical protein [bacterium]